MWVTLKWIGRVVIYLLLAFFILMVYFGVSTRIFGGPPAIFGREMYVVLSGSMEPGIHVGSVIFDTPNVDVSKLAVGDVITFKNPDDPSMMITHRIRNVYHHGSQLEFRTKGDANNATDPFLVPSQNVIAQYDNFTIPYIGYYLEFVKTKLGMGLMLIVPGALLIITQMISLVRTLRGELGSKKKSLRNPKPDSNSHIG